MKEEGKRFQRVQLRSAHLVTSLNPWASALHGTATAHTEIAPNVVSVGKKKEKKNRHITALLFLHLLHTLLAQAYTHGIISLSLPPNRADSTQKPFSLTENGQAELLFALPGLVPGDAGVVSLIQLGHLHYGHFGAVVVEAVLLSRLQNHSTPDGANGWG